MKIFVTGTRGIPNIPGGVESHCEHLYPVIAGLGHEVLLCRRSTYIEDRLTAWNDVQLTDCFSPRKKSLEAIIHTFLAILRARRWNADLVHIHAVGPALLVPFARLLGLKVVMTNHGPDYDRQKWGWLARKALATGEKLGGIFSNEVIVISEVIRDIVQTRCNRGSHLIYNGVDIPEITEDTSYLDNIGAEPGNYILAVARFVPEKGLHDLIDAFLTLDLGCQLIIAGDSDHPDKYSTELKDKAAKNSRIILTGYIKGDKLAQVFSHARLFALPSYHEGLPIALLEALSYGLPALVSDIPANKEVALPDEQYFRTGDINDLAAGICRLWQSPFDQVFRDKTRVFVQNKYDWHEIAKQTVLVYKKAVGK